MKNITLSIDDDTYRLARIAAAKRSTTVSALVRDYLQSVARSADESTEATESLFKALDRARGFRASDRMSRERAHER
jgi:hypothetical protein